MNPDNLTIGRAIAGRYRLDEVIDRGGTSIVYRAFDLLLNRTVAIKNVSDSIAHAHEFPSRFLNEVRSDATLVHPSIVTLYDAIEEGGRSYLVIEYVDGPSLREILETGPSAPDRVIDIAQQLAEALHFAQDRGVVHGDIKPENVLINQDGRAKLLNFGLVRFAADISAMRTTALGTADYLAPEQLEGQAPSPASDGYALGVILYEMLAGRLPFDGTTSATRAAQRLLRDPIPLGQVVAGIPTHLEAVVMRSIARSPESRYQTAADFEEQLFQLMRNDETAQTKILEPDEGTSPLLTPPAKSLVALPIQGRPLPRRHRSPFRLLVIPVVLLLLLGIGTLAFAFDAGPAKAVRGSLPLPSRGAGADGSQQQSGTTQPKQVSLLASSTTKPQATPTVVPSTTTPQATTTVVPSTATPRSTATSQPTATPSAPLPVDTAQGTILEKGQTWRQRGLELTLTDTNLVRAGGNFGGRLPGVGTQFSLKNGRQQDLQLILSLGNFSAIDNRGRRLPVMSTDTSSGFIAPVWARSIRLKPDETLRRVEDGFGSHYVFFPVDLSDLTLTEVVVSSSVGGITAARWRIPIAR